jgi:hypothetical protein
MLANGAGKARKPRPFRFTERRPKLSIRQVTRPNYHVTPTYIVPAPAVVYHPHPYAGTYSGSYPYMYHPPAVATYPGYSKAPVQAPVPKSKTTDEVGKPVYPEWAREVLGKYRPHHVIVHPHPYYHAHPYGGHVMVLGKVPTLKQFKDDKYYSSLKDAADKARYHYAFDTCARKGKMWSS